MCSSLGTEYSMSLGMNVTRRERNDNSVRATPKQASFACGVNGDESLQ